MVFQAGARERPNSGMHPTRNSVALKLNLVGGRVMPAFGGLWRNLKPGDLRAGFLRKKTVASSERGVIGFPSSRRGRLVADVARSALSPRRVAAEQANAPDRRHA